MDALRVTKVEGVECSKDGKKLSGTLHLTAHHLIFHYEDSSNQEMWIPYPLISLVTRAPQSLQGKAPLTFQLRTFESFSLFLTTEKDCLDVFESVKELTVATSVTQLYAFHYTPNPKFDGSDGWTIYNPRDEFGRMGLGTRTKAWRFTDINKDYSFCSTYPAKLVIPTRISDTTLQYASKYRSKCRIPALTYLHWGNYGSITRSSQPMVGMTQNRSIQDEKLIEAIFQTHHSPDTRAVPGPVYGATSTNLIIDARPTANALANSAKGAGTENMDNYKEGKKAYLGIDNIHTMRDSLMKVVEALREADSLLASINQDLTENIPQLAVLDRQALRRSGWLRHITTVLEGSLLIIRNVHINSSHVLIHCSDGWDRTAQLSSISQLCLDPFYRTTRGFEILVEKDWLSFGHKFLDRCGHLSSEKFFVSATENVPGGGGGGAEAAQAFLASMQNRFVGSSHLKETSPVFHQFLETVFQLQRQFPQRFEFNERFLRQMHNHLYSCQFGTFLFNCEKERRVGEQGEAAPWTRTVSVWDYFNSKVEMEKNRNPDYDSTLDDPHSRRPGADMGVLFPNPSDVRFWNELYGRSDEEMNGRVFVPGIGPDTGMEDTILDAGTTPVPTTIPLPPSPSPTPLPYRSTTPTPQVQMESTASNSEILQPKPSRTDGLRPFDNTGSNFTMKTQNGPSSTMSSPRGLKPAEFLTSGSGAGKAFWGKLSSNASAALSVMHGAYEGVAKELMGPIPTSPDGPKPAELHNKEYLNAWSSSSEPQLVGVSETRSLRGSPAPFKSSSRSTPVPQNPWATVGVSPQSQSVPGLLDNPWETSPSGSASITTLSSATSSDLSLPMDPTVAQIGIHRSASPLRSAGASSDRTSTVKSPASGSQAASVSPPSDNTDPLGVGFT